MALWPEMADVPFAIRFCRAGDVKTRYLEAGDTSKDEAVVFVHGTGGHLEAFNRNILAHATAGYRTIALDMVGHGFSDKPDYPYEIPVYVKHLKDFCDSLGLKRIHLHGESLGGWIAAQFSIDYPGRVASLILNTAGGLNSDPVVMNKVYTLTMEAVRSASFDTVRRRLEFLVHDKKDIPDDLVELRLKIYSQPGFVDTMEHILCLQHMDIRLRNSLDEARLAKIDIPTLVIWTEHDPTAPVAVGERFARAIPNAKLVVLENCAHWPQWEDPKRFNEIHLAFLAAAANSRAGLGGA